MRRRAGVSGVTARSRPPGRMTRNPTVCAAGCWGALPTHGLANAAAFDHVDFATRDWVPTRGGPLGSRHLILSRSRRRRAQSGAQLLRPQAVGTDWDHCAAARARSEPAQILLLAVRPLAQRQNGLSALWAGVRHGRRGQCARSAERHCHSHRYRRGRCEFPGLEVSTIDGVRSSVRATAAVLAASGIENPRLLLISRGVHPNGLGNQNDIVGRFLMDHPTTRIGRFKVRRYPSGDAALRIIRPQATRPRSHVSAWSGSKQRTSGARKAAALRCLYVGGARIGRPMGCSKAAAAHKEWQANFRPAGDCVQPGPPRERRRHAHVGERRLSAAAQAPSMR